MLLTQWSRTVYHILTAKQTLIKLTKVELKRAFTTISFGKILPLE